ncbi:hypothetical protein PEL8287_01388 [Roseovarius litorisediminis]|uniref:Uncharacterized protein n=1 Tax=Roseovarius litorisediminis TaxID=1312363 RepID=A0A1Y5S0S9_9RHOB|nr:hypothetical protein PEL8287_01388 [Roseovarius litorisediminis]
MTMPFDRMTRRVAPKPKRRAFLFACLLLLSSTLIYVEMALRFSQ